MEIHLYLEEEDFVQHSNFESITVTKLMVTLDTTRYKMKGMDIQANPLYIFGLGMHLRSSPRPFLTTYSSVPNTNYVTVILF